MDLKQTAIDTAKSAKFDRASVHLSVVNSRLEVNLDLYASIDLPGDLDQVVANIGGMIGLGNSPAPSTSPAP